MLSYFMMHIPLLAVHSWAQVSSSLTLVLSPVPFDIWDFVTLKSVYKVINFLDYSGLIKEKKRPSGAQEGSSSFHVPALHPFPHAYITY